jgi:hypothetical protein
MATKSTLVLEAAHGRGQRGKRLRYLGERVVVRLMDRIAFSRALVPALGTNAPRDEPLRHACAY